MFFETAMRFYPYQLWQDPPIVATQIVRRPELEALLRELPRGAHLLYHCPNRDCFPFFCGAHAFARRFSGITLHFIANTDAELARYRTLGAPAAYGPVSLYSDETSFKPQPVAKEFDAIYVAGFVVGMRNDVKRHLLAAELGSLCVVTVPLTPRRMMLRLEGMALSRAYHETYPELRHATLNDHYLSESEVAEAFSRARVNLALSAAEGCMLAFSEGLLCGVPGVSTECRSARSEFFDDRYVTVVKPDASLVARAVEELAARELDPEEVRSFALGRLRAMRARYAEYIAGIAATSTERVYAHLFEVAGGIQRLACAQPGMQPPTVGPG